MLPKVATHILHTTSRAAAAVHNQTSTLRNVLQLQTSPGPSAAAGSPPIGPWNGNGSSSWGNHGPGPGGAKQNTGSRFHTGFTGPVRAVTQANAVGTQDGTFIQHEDNQEETAPVTTRRAALRAPKETRLRKSSASIGAMGRREHPTENLGVLKTVQIHARSRHAFTQPSSTIDTAKSTGTAPSQESSVQRSRPLIARRNSISSPASGTSHSLIIPSRRNSTSVPAGRELSSVEPTSIPLPPSPQSSTIDLPLVDPATPQSAQPRQQQSRPSSRNAKSQKGPRTPQTVQETPAYVALKAARDTKDPSAAADTVRHFRQTTENPTVREFNIALEALVSTRRVGEPLTLLSEIYDDIIKLSLIPTVKTYTLLVQALTDRDHEVQKVVRSILNRIQRRKNVTGDLELRSQSADERRLATLLKEDNFSSALVLFDKIVSVNGSSRLPSETYHSLLRSCAYLGNASAASHIFSQLESRENIKPSSLAYKYLIQAYVNAGEIDNAERAFTEYRDICKGSPEKLAWGSGETTYDQRRVLMVWNQMIDAYFKAGRPDQAIGLVELMMGAVTTPPKSWSTVMDVPSPASSTFTAVLAGFCDSGDVRTALVWFDRLLEQQHAPREDPLSQTLSAEAIRPDYAAWNVMIESLASQGMVDELNAVFEKMLTVGAKDGIKPTAFQGLITFAANMKRMPSLNTEDAEKTLKFLTDKVVVLIDDSVKRSAMVRRIWKECLSRGLFERGADSMLGYAGSLVSQIQGGVVTMSAASASALDIAKDHLVAFSARLYEQTQGEVPFNVALRLSRFAKALKHEPPFADGHMPFVLHSYGLARRAGTLPVDMKPTEWVDILNAAVQVDAAEIDRRQDVFPVVSGYSFEGVVSLLKDMEASGVSLSSFKKDFVDRVLKVLFLKYDMKELEAITRKLGSEFQVQMQQTEPLSPAPTLTGEEQVTNTSSNASSPTLYNPGPESTQPSPTSPSPSFKLSVDTHLSREIDDLLRSSMPAKEAAEEAFKRMFGSLQRGRLPTASIVGRIIQSLGRAGEVDKVKEVYGVAQNALSRPEGLKHWLPDSWFKIEDSMVIALAHAGDVEAAHVHRGGILASGGAPSADAYGVLILYMKDTTDDTSNALTLFQEAEARNVIPNQYLYNNIISKLAKARKAEHALELFNRMKSQEIHPTSITYGAVIGACARVGDVQSAEVLFAEMESARNFKPRVPPYNTMMQLYTTTKPNRERALFYYDKMKQARVAPTAHTYKLLMDAYGTLDPSDIESMEQVFLSLRRDTSVPIQGSHFASLIHAYGCVGKDLAKAVSTFDSIPSYHPRSQPADAVVYEAMINVLVAHKKDDLIEDYVNKMKDQGVRMTAYVSNFLIKGYANARKLDRARAIFEGLADPPEGVAAPGNHIPHDGAAPQGHNSVAEQVYREPSTWEVMIRAELGAGEKARALDLLERLKARKYPDAVFNRISGILVDHSLVL